MPTGRQAYEKAKTERGSLTSSGDEVRLKDGDVARIRFISTMDNFFWCYTHSQPVSSRLGKTWFKDVFCSMQDGIKCEFCDSKIEDDRRAKQKFFFWVHLYGIYHAVNNKEGTLKPATYIGQQFFYEPINAFKILVSGAGKEGSTFKKFENWEKRYKTLNDRDYDWARTGNKLDTTYDLIPCEEGPQSIDPEILKKVGTLTPIETKVRELTIPVILTSIADALGSAAEDGVPAVPGESLQANLAARAARLAAEATNPNPVTTPVASPVQTPITRANTSTPASVRDLAEELF